MKRYTQTKVAAAVRAQTGYRSLITAILATGGGLASAPVAALELGEVQISSFLGQPLRARIAYRLGPDEMLSEGCVSLERGATVSGLPNVLGARVSVADGVISVTGSSVAREPLMMMRVNIRCAYAPQLTRDYMLFIDPEQPAASAGAVAPSAEPVPASRPTAAVTAPSRVERRAVASREPISSSTRYRVQPGDSLSVIAQRVEDRPIGLWDAAARIFEANPEAFIDDDPNRLKAGVWLDIPDFAAADAGTGVTAEIFRASPEPVAVESVSNATMEPTAAYEPPSEAAGATDPASATLAVEPSGLEFEPRDIGSDAETPEVTGGTESTPIPDIELPGPETRSTSPVVTTAAPAPRAPEAESGSMIGWILGAVVALIGGLLLLRQRFLPRFGRAPVEPVAAPPPREKDAVTQRMEAIRDVDVAIDDEPPTEDNLALEADLVMSTGLAGGTEIEVADDVAFAMSANADLATNIDFELPEEPSADETVISKTDILPPLDQELESILDSEVLPVDDDDDPEMSVIIDAARAPEPEAFAGDASEEVPVYDLELTAEQEADLRILEQDYEDELTATQALNKEIEKAAAELAERFGEDSGEPADSDASSTLIAALDVTAQLPAHRVEEVDEDELTATRALNKEIEEASAEPAEEIGEEPDSDASSTLIAALDVTAQLPAHVVDEADEDELTATQAMPREARGAAAELAGGFGADEGEEPASDTSSTLIAGLDVTSQLPVRGDAEAEEDEQPDYDEAVTVILACEDPTEETLALDEEDTAETLIGDDEATAEMPIRRR